jgi:hypothetical protein
MEQEMKMKIHEIVNYATRTLERHDAGDEHWETLSSLLRFRAKEYIAIYNKNNEEE